MKADKVLRREILRTGPEVAEKAQVRGHSRRVRIDGRRLVLVRTDPGRVPRSGAAE